MSAFLVRCYQVCLVSRCPCLLLCLMGAAMVVSASSLVNSPDGVGNRKWNDALPLSMPPPVEVPGDGIQVLRSVEHELEHALPRRATYFMLLLLIKSSPPWAIPMVLALVR